MLRPILLAAFAGAWLAPLADRRIVDQVVVGDARNERDHAYAGEGILSGVANGREYRQATGWIRYALGVFDDTPVTISCTFAGTQSPRTFDLVVENTAVATYTFDSADSSTVDLRVPLAVTSGRTNILVMLRANHGPVPALVSLRSIQDHNE